MFVEIAQMGYKVFLFLLQVFDKFENVGQIKLDRDNNINYFNHIIHLSLQQKSEKYSTEMKVNLNFFSESLIQCLDILRI